LRASTRACAMTCSMGRDLLHPPRSSDRHRKLAAPLQYDQAACLTRLQATSTRGVRARLRRVAGCATSTGFAGHAGATANLKLTFHRQSGLISLPLSGPGGIRARAVGVLDYLDQSTLSLWSTSTPRGHWASPFRDNLAPAARRPDLRSGRLHARVRKLWARKYGRAWVACAVRSVDDPSQEGGDSYEMGKRLTESPKFVSWALMPDSG
jgi:hypothetical protein